MPDPLQVPGVIVMEIISDDRFTSDSQWQRIVVAFNASSREYRGVPCSFAPSAPTLLLRAYKQMP